MNQAKVLLLKLFHGMCIPRVTILLTQVTGVLSSSPYALIPSIAGDTTIGRVEGVDLEVGPDDIIKSLDLAAMLQLETHHASGFG